MSTTTRTTPEHPPAEEAKPRGRLVRDPFAVAVSDACDLFNGLPDGERGLLLHVLTARYGPTPAQRLDDAR